MSVSSALGLTKLKLRLQQAIANNERAKKGSDLTYRRECKDELQNVRNLIIKELKGKK